MSDPTPIIPGAKQEFKDQAINDNFQRMQDRFRTNVIKDETGTNRLIFGKLPDGTYGLVISKEGIDVLTVFL